MLDKTDMKSVISTQHKDYAAITQKSLEIYETARIDRTEQAQPGLHSKVTCSESRRNETILARISLGSRVMTQFDVSGSILPSDDL